MNMYALCVKQVGRKERGWFAFDWADLHDNKPKLTWKESLWYTRKSDGCTCVAGSMTSSLVKARHLVPDVRRIGKKKATGKFKVEIWKLDHHGNPCEKVRLRFRKDDSR